MPAKKSAKRKQRTAPAADSIPTKRDRRIPPALPPINPHQLYSVEQALLYRNQSRRTFYADIAAGRIETIAEGHRQTVDGKVYAGRRKVPGWALLKAVGAPQ